MEPIESITLSQRAANAIRQNIVSGGYEQGRKLTEEECAAALGLSRVCVRDAFLKLQEEGLLTKKVNKCTTVAVFTAEDVKDIYYLRLSLEKMCSTLCFERDRLPVDKLETIYGRMVALAQREDLAPMELLTEDMNFHRAIVDAAGNNRAAKVWHDIESQILTVLFPVQAAYIREHDKLHNTKEHRALLDALATRNTAVSHPILEKHVLHSMSTLLRLYEK